MFRRFFDDGLAQSSYLIASAGAREAVVVDPRRDVDVYVAAARQAGVTITHAIETHIHADFVSGARELAALGARVITGPGADLAFEHHELHDDELLRLGDLTLQFLHTPGHTPEHISILVREPDAPARLLTGDTLFVGAVGRPDLLGEEQARGLAGDLHESLFHRILALDDAVEVHPGHGAGSLCGAGIGGDPHSTVGRERTSNPMLRHRDRQEFVEAVLADLPETPPYFPRMKRINRDGPAVLGLSRDVPPLVALPAAEAADRARSGAVILDLRPADQFGQGHARAALNIAFGPKIGYWAGWVIEPGERVILILDGGERQALEARRQLLRVGIDRVDGFVAGGFGSWRAAGLPTGEVPQISVHELRERVRRGGAMTVLDVRTRKEWQKGHLQGAVHVPMGEVLGRTDEIARDRPVATICEGGFRSSLASSLLPRAGFTSIMNVSGGMSAYRAMEAAS